MSYDLTPKEKAFQLVENTRMVAMQPAMSYFDNNDACNNYYKLLTLLQVDAVESTNTLQKRGYGFFCHKEYWSEVRYEILKL